MKLNIRIDTADNKCQYENCVNYDDGICLSEESRKDCLEIALAVLCINKENEIERKCCKNDV